MKNKKAFTLVELIVVITILAILGTIAFISLRGYSASARDSRRISDGSNIKKTLALYKINTSYYPEPTDFETIIIENSGSINLWKQGNFGDQAFKQVKKISKKPLDPETEKEYSYSTTLNKKEYEIKLNLENTNLSLSPLNKVIAKEIIPQIMGDYNGYMLIGSDHKYYAVPSLFSSDVTVGPNTLFSMTGKETIFEVKSLKNKTSGEDLTYNDVKINKLYEDFGLSLQESYSGSSLKNDTDYSSILSTPANALASLGESIIAGTYTAVVVNTNTPVASTGGETCKFDEGKFDDCVFE